MRTLTVIIALFTLVGCQSSAPRDYTPTLARFFLESTDARAVPVALPQSGVKLALASAPAITEGDIVNVEIAQVELGRCLMFELTPSAARDLYRLTGSNQGRRLVLMVDGAVLGARRIDGPIPDGRVFVFVELPDSALPSLVSNLKKTSAELQRAAAKRK